MKYESSKAIGRILAMVEESGCTHIVTEENPEEKEFAEEHNRFYKNVFTTTSDSVDRLHFFTGHIEEISEIEHNDARYLGYCDIRPLRPPSISGALLDQKVFIKKNNNFLFLVCKRSFDIAFNGKSLKVEAFPYVQQDGRIIRCAQAALTSISTFYENGKTGPDFTEIASEIPTGHRSIPSPGMTGQQIGRSLEAMGQEAVLYEYWSDNSENVPLQHREQIIYRYLESGIPVLVGVVAGTEMHALVIVGHTFTPDSWGAQTRTDYFRHPKTGFIYHCCTNWIERFVVQDDNLGPYTLILSDFLQYYGCKLIAVGLPPGIFCMAEDAEAFVGDLLSPRGHNIINTFDHYRNEFKSSGKTIHPETDLWYDQFKVHTNKDELVLRTYLRTSSQWKEKAKTLDTYPEYKDLLDTLPLPERVWVVEISWPQIFRHGRRLCGEIIIDTTDQINPGLPTLDQGWLWMHIPGVILWRDAKTCKKGVRVLEAYDAIKRHRFTCE